MNTERWRLRWRPAPREWFRARNDRLSVDRRRTLRFALDRALQNIARCPYSNSWCGVRYPSFATLPETYRVVNVADMLLFYRVDEQARMVIFVRMQMMRMALPSIDALRDSQP